MKKFSAKSAVRVSSITILREKREVKNIVLEKSDRLINPLEKYFEGVKGLKRVSAYGVPAIEYRQFSRLRQARERFQDFLSNSGDSYRRNLRKR